MNAAALTGKRIALIGGAGFIGHHLALHLKQRGADVHIIDGLQVNNLLQYAGKNNASETDRYLNMIHERLDRIRHADIPLHPLDARYYLELGNLLNRDIKPQIIVHLAAVAHAGRSNKDPYSTFDHSLRTLENALDCARDQVEQFIYFSSSMVYGNFLSQSVDEEHPLNPIGIYGALKLAGEKLVIAYNQVFDLPYTIIRPSALYGPRCVSRRVIQIFIENALDGKPLRVDGDGSERLDFTYIDDLVEGICATMQRPQARNQIFNLTFGGSRSISDVVDILGRYFPGTPVENVERDKLMPFRGTLSVDKARSLLGYAPGHDLEIGLEKYINWYQSFEKTQAPLLAGA